MTMVVKHGRQNAGNLHRCVPKKNVFFGRPRPNDLEIFITDNHTSFH